MIFIITSFISHNVELFWKSKDLKVELLDQFMETHSTDFDPKILNKKLKNV